MIMLDWQSAVVPGFCEKPASYLVCVERGDWVVANSGQDRERRRKAKEPSQMLIVVVRPFETVRALA